MTGFWIIVCHLIGDYLLQSDWMAQNKTKNDLPAMVHAVLYTMPFWLFGMVGLLPLRGTILVIPVILWTHFAIDRWRLARYVVWAKNWLAPKCRWYYYKFRDGFEWWMPELRWGQLSESPHARRTDYVQYREEMRRTQPWENCKGTGYPQDVPPWLSTWLMIIADNTIHLLIAGLAITYL